jgi:hypothetical protein
MALAIYGGRIDNAFDYRVLLAYLNQIFCDEAIVGAQRPLGNHLRMPS